MPEVVNSDLRMYADGTKIARQVDSEEDREFTIRFEDIKDWADTWQLRFNATKCKVMHLGRNNGCHEYIMEQNVSQMLLTVTECEKDFGVNVDRDLKFSNHVKIVSNKANRLCGMIRRLKLHEWRYVQLPF